MRIRGQSAWFCITLGDLGAVAGWRQPRADRRRPAPSAVRSMIAVWVRKTALSAAGCTQTAIMGGRVRSVPRTCWGESAASRILDAASPLSWNLANLDHFQRSRTEGRLGGSLVPEVT